MKNNNQFVLMMSLLLVGNVNLFGMDADEALFMGVDQELLTAARVSDLAGVQAALAAGANPNVQNTYGDTALIIAIDSNRLGMARILIAAGADRNIQNRYGDTALITAIIFNRTAIVQDLIDARADLNVQTYYNRDTALTISIDHNKPEAAQILIAAGANLNVHNRYGKTALMIAQEYNISVPFLQAVIDANRLQDLDDQDALGSIYDELIAIDGNDRTVEQQSVLDGLYNYFNQPLLK